MKRFLLTALLLPLTACTHLETTRVTGNDVIEGVTYYLPKSKIKYTVSYQVESCGVETIDVKQSVDSITTIPAKDESIVYLLNFNSMASVTKTADLDIQFYDNGLIKSINAGADDKSAEIVGSVISGIAKIATMKIPGKIPLDAASVQALTQKGIQKDAGKDKPKDEKYVNACSQEVQDALTAKSEMEGNLKGAQEAVKKQIELINKIRSDVVTTSETEASEDKKSKGNKPPNLNAQFKKLAELNEKLQEAQEEYDTNKAARSFTQHYEFYDNHTTVFKVKDENGEEKDVKKYRYKLEPDSKLYTKWVNKEFNKDVYNLNKKNEVDKKGPGITAYETLQEQLTTEMVLFASVGPENTDYITKTPEPGVVKKGILYRVPVYGSVKVCKENFCDNSTNAEKKLFDNAMLLPGLGRIALLPFTNEAFQNNNLVVNFSEAGTLTQLTYKTNAPAERAAGLFDSTADQFVDYTKAKEQKPITDLENQIKYQKTLKEYQELTKEPNAELKALELENELRMLSGKLDQLSNDELTRELNRIKLQQQINELNKQKF